MKCTGKPDIFRLKQLCNIAKETGSYTHLDIFGKGLILEQGDYEFKWGFFAFPNAKHWL